jgi:hypothetical protein
MGLSLFRALLVFPLALAALPILFIPFFGVSPELHGGLFAAFFLGVSLCAAAVPLIYYRRRPALMPPLVVFSGAGLLIVALSSAVVHRDALSLYAGSGFETGTVGFFALLFAAAIFGSLLNRVHIRLVTGVFVASTLIGAAFLLASYMLGGKEGAWPHLSFLLAAALTFCIIKAQRREAPFRNFFIAGALLLAAAFFLFFYATAAVIAGSILLGYGSLRAISSSGAERFVPAVLASGALLMAAAGMGIASPLALPPDVRLAFEATTKTGASEYLSFPGALIGSGPNSFGVVWERNRPAEFNRTPLWDNAFVGGYSTVLTWLVTLGFLGVFFYALPLFAIGYLRLKERLRGVMAPDEEYAAVASLALFSFAAALLYPASLTLLLVGGLAFGCCARLLKRTAPAMVVLELPSRIGRSLVCVLVGALLCTLSVFQGYAALLHTQGLRAFGEGSVEEARGLLTRAAAAYPASSYLQDASRASLESARLEASTPGANDEKIRRAITEARGFAAQARGLYPKEYQVYLSEGSLLVTLLVAGAMDAGEEAADALARAKYRSPTRPQIPFVEAVLHEAKGDLSAARASVEEALRLKPDYAPALDLARRLQGGE